MVLYPCNVALLLLGCSKKVKTAAGIKCKHKNVSNVSWAERAVLLLAASHRLCIQQQITAGSWRSSDGVMALSDRISSVTKLALCSWATVGHELLWEYLSNTCNYIYTLSRWVRMRAAGTSRDLIDASLFLNCWKRSLFTRLWCFSSVRPTVHRSRATGRPRPAL